MQHVHERGPAFERDGEPLGEAGEDRYAGAGRERVERTGDRSAGTHLAEHPREVTGQLTVGAADDPLDGGHRPLSCGHRQRQQVCDRRELREHLFLTSAYGRTQRLIAGQHSSGERGGTSDQRRAGRQARTGRPEQHQARDARQR